MAENPHAWTYAPPRPVIGPSVGFLNRWGPRGRLARRTRAALADDAVMMRRGVQGRRAVAVDTFGLAACWPPRWRRRQAMRAPYRPGRMAA